MAAAENSETGLIICQCNDNSYVKDFDLKQVITFVQDNLEVSFIGMHPSLCSRKIGISYLSRLLDRDIGKLAILACHPKAQRWLFEEILDKKKLNGNFIPINFHGATTEEVISQLEKVFPRKSEKINEWFPVINYERCLGLKACGACYDYCIYGVFGIKDDDNDGVIVKNPYKCKDKCPACARLCPVRAIIFPKSSDGWIAGKEIQNAEKTGQNAREITLEQGSIPQVADAVKNAGTISFDKDIPDESTRMLIREKAPDAAGRLGEKDVEKFAVEFLNQLGIKKDYRRFTVVELKNESLKRKFAETPYERRVIIIPHCLRDQARCKGKYEDVGGGVKLVCAECGSKECNIFPLKKASEKLGYTVFVAEGSTVVLKLLTEKKKGIAFLGIGCLDSLYKSIPKLDAFGISARGVPLLKSGCKNTVVELDRALESIFLVPK